MSLVEAPSVDRRGDPTQTVHGAADLGIATIACSGCGREYPVGPHHVCDICFAPLEIVYDYTGLRDSLSRASIAAGPRTIWRYADLLPVPHTNRVDLGTGLTPLRPAPRLAAELGLRNLWLKNDSLNPTNSFKDRVVSVALTAARYFGFATVACASTGNLANSVAAHAAASGLRSVVFIPDDLEEAKVAGSAVYGGHVVRVRGCYDDVNRLCAELAATNPWGFVNVNLRSFYSEGSKTVGFEIAEQLGWRTPDTLVLPVASGSLLTKTAKSFQELHKTALLDHESDCRFYGAQPQGCSPIASAFSGGKTDVTPVRPDTKALSLAIGDPANGREVLEVTRSTGGAVEAVSDAEMTEAIRLLARTEGIFTETAGGVTVAALEKLCREGRIRPEDETVAVITGHGLKTIEALGDPRTIGPLAPDLDVVSAALRRD